MKVFRLIALLVFYSVVSSAWAVCPEAPTSQYSCKGKVLISNQEELQNYLLDFGLNNSKTYIRAAHLTGSFSQISDLHLATPCSIRVLENTTIDASGEVCLISGDSTIAHTGVNLKATNATLKAPNQVVIRDNFTGILSGDLNLISTGTTIDSRAHIRHTSNVQAQNLTLKALRRATLGHTSTYNVAGKILVSSNGEDLPDDAELGVSEWSSIWRDTQILTGSLEITALDKVRIASGVSVNAQNVLLDGKSCRLNTAGQIEAPIKTGSCFSGLMPVAKLKVSPNGEAELNSQILFDASRSYFNEGAKFIWSFYNISSSGDGLIEESITTVPTKTFSFSSLEDLGEKRIHLRVESLEGYYSELKRKITIVSPAPILQLMLKTYTPRLKTEQGQSYIPTASHSPHLLNISFKITEKKSYTMNQSIPLKRSYSNF